MIGTIKEMHSVVQSKGKIIIQGKVIIRKGLRSPHPPRLSVLVPYMSTIYLQQILKACYVPAKKMDVISTLKEFTM